MKAFLPRVTRQEARKLIYGTVLAAALPDAMGAHESAMPTHFGTACRIAVRIKGAGSA